MKEHINIVWLKRDLRLQDHIPLDKAENHNLNYLIIYLLEPKIIGYPDTSTRHLQFVYQSVQEINRVLDQYNRRVEILYGEALDAFLFLTEKFSVKSVFSYQESGINLTWERDKEISSFLKKRDISWEESQRDGVIRGIKNRTGWDKKWFTSMNSSILTNKYTINTSKQLEHDFHIPKKLLEELSKWNDSWQPAGEYNALRYLHSFLENRGFEYHRQISKPEQSRISCSRLSVYLAWGNLSVKQIYQTVKNHKNYPYHKRAFGSFLQRIKWHCHFIQKFEVECSYETHCVNKGYELLAHNSNPVFTKAWMTGHTGYPLVDACMRCVASTGWINFRMRAMVVSFFCHHLDQDWRDGSHYLAQQFLDYEPGIHYPQFQMQAGTTGVNTVRIYNPVKQSKDHDPEGVFIKTWVSELKNVPPNHIHEPWNMTTMEQAFCEVCIGKDYPAPIVDLKESGENARNKIWGHRKNSLVKKEQKRILHTHTRRKK